MSSQFTVKLPNGAIDDENPTQPIREVEMRYLDGDDEDAMRDRSISKEKGNPFDRILRNTIIRVGGYTEKRDIARVFSSTPLADHNFLLIAQRRHSIDEKYPFQLDCPHCGEVRSYSIDLSTLTVTEQPDEYRGKRTIEMPVAGVGLVEFRQLFTTDQAGLEVIASQYPKEKGTRELLLQVKSIDGRPVDAPTIRKMALRQRNAIRNAIDSTMGGVNTELEVTCANPKCERGFTARMPLDVRSFFFQQKGGSSTEVRPYLRSGTTLTSWLSGSSGPQNPSEGSP